jgi:hypothetical protein
MSGMGEGRWGRVGLRGRLLEVGILPGLPLGLFLAAVRGRARLGGSALAAGLALLAFASADAQAGPRVVVAGGGGGGPMFTAGPSSSLSSSSSLFYPGGIVSGEFDSTNNSNLDIATTNYSSGEVTVMLGNGSGGFTQAPGSPISLTPGIVPIATAKFGTDPYPDLAVANETQSPATVTILKGDGQGGFSTGQSISLACQPTGLATGHFNADAYTDLAVAEACGQVQVFLGSATGTFTPASGSPISLPPVNGCQQSPAAIVAGQLAPSSSSNVDLAVLDAENNAVDVLLGNGAGTFTQPSAPFFTGGSAADCGTYSILGAFSLTVGNFGGDHEDLAAGLGNGQVSVLLGDGSGNYSLASGSPVQVAPANTQFTGLAKVPSLSGGQDGIAAGGYYQGGCGCIDYDADWVGVMLTGSAGQLSAAAGSPYELDGVTGPLVAGSFMGGSADDIVAADAGSCYGNDVVTLINQGSAGGQVPPSNVYPGDGCQIPPPGATTGSAQSVGATSATLTGTVAPAWGSPITGCQFEYGIGNFNSSAPCSPEPAYGLQPTVSASLTGLTPGQGYEYRLVDSSAAGVGVGQAQQFQTSQQYPPPAAGGIEQVVFVHGINASCQNAGAEQQGGGGVGDYRALYQALAGQGMGVYTFCYSDDVAFASDPGLRGRCFSDTSRGEPGVTGITAPADGATSPDHIGPLYLSSNKPGTGGADDGDDPLALEAAKLDDCLSALVNYDIRTYGQPLPIAVIGNSMGGAITRGWLALAKWRGSRALDGVTTAFFVEGATEGSWIAAVGQGVDAGIAGIPVIGSTLDSEARSLAASSNLNPGRAGVQDLAPGSAYYRSIVNSGPPPRLHYFALSVDIYVHLDEQVLWWTTQLAQTDAIGDGVMELGSSSPTALPTWGGSQFLPFGSAADQHQYVIRRDYYETYNALTPWTTSLSNPYSDPYNHFNFGTYMGKENAQLQFTGGLVVPSCDRSDGTLAIPDEILRVLENPAQACSAGAAADVAGASPLRMAADAGAPTGPSRSDASLARARTAGEPAREPVRFQDRFGRAELALYTARGPQQGSLTLVLRGLGTFLTKLPPRLAAKPLIRLNRLVNATRIGGNPARTLRLRLRGLLKPGSHYAKLIVQATRPRLHIAIISPTPNVAAAKKTSGHLLTLISKGNLLGLARMLSPSLLQGVSPAQVAAQMRAQAIHIKRITPRGRGHTIWLADGNPGWIQPVTAVARGRPTLRVSLVLEQNDGTWWLLATTS